MRDSQETARLLQDDKRADSQSSHAGRDTTEDLLLPDEESHFQKARRDDYNPKHSLRGRLVVALLVLVTAGIVFVAVFLMTSSRQPKSLQFSLGGLREIQQCAIDNLHQDLSFLDDAPPITPSEFITRRDRLAQALHIDGVAAFVLEPGYTFQYYGNVSQQDWEPWEPEERPFLMVVQPHVTSSGHVTAKTTYLSPAFEADRVRMLGIPSTSELDIVTWEEHWNPYDTLLHTTFKGNKHPKIMTDEELRDYIVRGLTASGFNTVGLTPNVDAVRQQKTSAEIALLRAVNTGTVEAVRSMRPCLVPGLTENQVIAILDNALLSVPGFSLFFNIVLFDENAALPHGGKATGGKTLDHDTVVLIDVGAHYRGYSSDICRSFLIEPAEGRSRKDAVISSEAMRLKHKVFETVLAAQDASIRKFRPGNTAASVDIAAREVIGREGWEKYFTHRVGHGIGIKAHESPYLNKGNTEVKLRENMTFTSEPGVYMTDKFGVRTEDIFVVTEQGKQVECLSGPRAKSLWEP